MSVGCSGRRSRREGERRARRRITMPHGRSASSSAASGLAGAKDGSGSGGFFVSANARSLHVGERRGYQSKQTLRSSLYDGHGTRGIFGLSHGMAGAKSERGGPEIAKVTTMKTSSSTETMRLIARRNLRVAPPSWKATGSVSRNNVLEA